MLGNCGCGFAPVKPEDRDRALLMMTRTEQIPFQTMKAGMRWAWETFPEWLDNLQRIPKGVNCVSYVPVSPLMVYVMGLEAAKTRPATPAQRRQMQRLLHEAMDAGACGFSVQRLGSNSLQADHDGTPMPTDCMADEDVLALADVLHERDEGFIQITQSQVGNPETASAEENARDIQFLETLAERAGRPVLHNVILALDAYPGAYRNSLEWLRDCNARGLRIYGQGFTGRIWFEYTFEDWNLYDFSAPWNHATQDTHEEKLAKLSDPAIRQAMRDDYPNFMTIGTGGPLEVITVKEAEGNLARYVGRTIGEIAEAEGKHVIDAILDIAVAGDLKPLFKTDSVGSSMTDPQAVAEMVSDPHVMAGLSDGGAHTKFFSAGSYTTDLLVWLVRDTQTLSLKEAHYHLSYLPAQAAGFIDRGYLRAGAPADIVVYDLENLKIVPEDGHEVVRDYPANEWRRVRKAEGGRLPLDPRQRRSDLRGRRVHRRDAGTAAAQRRAVVGATLVVARPRPLWSPASRPCMHSRRDATRASPTTPASRHAGVRIRLYWHGSTWEDGGTGHARLDRCDIDDGTAGGL